MYSILLICGERSAGNSKGDQLNSPGMANNDLTHVYKYKWVPAQYGLNVHVHVYWWPLTSNQSFLY